MSKTTVNPAREFFSWDGFLALGLGSGLAPFAPGTFGTAIAVPFILWLPDPGLAIYALLLVLAFVLGVVVCDRVGRRLGVADHGALVWDEMVGYWLTVMLLPRTWEWLLAGFVLFRVFDIIKPWPIRQLEKKVGGGLGVMLDDILAAVMAGSLLLLAQWGLSSI